MFIIRSKKDHVCMFVPSVYVLQGLFTEECDDICRILEEIDGMECLTIDWDAISELPIFNGLHMVEDEHSMLSWEPLSKYVEVEKSWKLREIEHSLDERLLP